MRADAAENPSDNGRTDRYHALTDVPAAEDTP